jgi:PPOX class probable FMN-dependent enzyme
VDNLAAMSTALLTELDSVTSTAELRAIVGTPSERAVRKQLAALDIHCRAFIARSPLLVLSTASAAGICDASPKGDLPGFVLVLDERTLVIPDRPGNRRADSLSNILDNPHVGLLFMIPGMDETLRVNGSARLVRNETLLERMSVDGRRPQLGIVVHVEECYLHCAKAFLRSKVWAPERYMPRGEMPSLARMIQDQLRPADRNDAEHERIVEEHARSTAEAYCKLY